MTSKLVLLSVSVGRFTPTPQAALGGAPTPDRGPDHKERALPMAGSHPMYPCPLTHGNLPRREGRADG